MAANAAVDEAYRTRFRTTIEALTGYPYAEWMDPLIEHLSLHHAHLEARIEFLVDWVLAKQEEVDAAHATIKTLTETMGKVEEALRAQAK